MAGRSQQRPSGKNGNSVYHLTSGHKWDKPTWVGASRANLDALAHTMALFLRAAVEVGKHLEYAWLSLNWLRRTIL
jgi:hypothetical protein